MSRTIDGWFASVPLSDSQLVARCLEGEARAERELYDRFVDRLYRVAFRLSGDPDRAADYTQEAFIRAFDRLDQFRGDSSLGTWLNTIVVSIALNALRKTKTFDQRHIELDETIPISSGNDPSPDLHGRLYAAIDRLPTKLRAVFVMHEIEGYTHEEIGTVLEIPTGTSKARLSDARARLRVALSAFAGDHIA